MKKSGRTVVSGKEAFQLHDTHGVLIDITQQMAAEQDPPLTVDLKGFEQEMEAAKVNYRYVAYPGAVHAFTNPEATDKGKQFNLPLAYNQEADKQSKAEMAKFLGEVFKR